MTDELLSINGNLGVLARLTGEIKLLVFWAGDPLAPCGGCRRQVCAEAEAGVAETGTEWALGLRPSLESSPPERWIGGWTAVPVFTARAEEVGLPGIKPWALASQVTFPHLSFFQELLPMAWCRLGETNLAACHSTDHILLSTGMGASSRGELPMYKQQWAQSCMGTADGHAAVGACSRIPPHVAVGFAVITETITAIIAL